MEKFEFLKKVLEKVHNNNNTPPSVIGIHHGRSPCCNPNCRDEGKETPGEMKNLQSH